MDFYMYKILESTDQSLNVVEGVVCASSYANALKSICDKYAVEVVLYLEKLNLWFNAIDLGEIMDGRASMEDMIEKFSKKS